MVSKRNSHIYNILINSNSSIDSYILSETSNKPTNQQTNKPTNQCQTNKPTNQRKANMRVTTEQTQTQH